MKLSSHEQAFWKNRLGQLILSSWRWFFMGGQKNSCTSGSWRQIPRPGPPHGIVLPTQSHKPAVSHLGDKGESSRSKVKVTRRKRRRFSFSVYYHNIRSRSEGSSQRSSKVRVKVTWLKFTFSTSGRYANGAFWFIFLLKGKYNFWQSEKQILFFQL